MPDGILKLAVYVCECACLLLFLVSGLFNLDRNFLDVINVVNITCCMYSGSTC